MQKQYDKFKTILKEMFQMDQADLDFGVYRIMNRKRTEIEKFLDQELLPQVKTEFGRYRGTETEEKKKELEALEKTLRESGVEPETAPKVKTLKEEIAKYGDDEAVTDEVFSHLSSFFRRYYDNGDFISLRRYKKDTYAIPYEGEEVKLHWANADQYYIKTTEYLKDYSFKLPDGRTVHFKLVDATQERDNNKTESGKERKFRLCEDPIRIEGKDCIIRFVYLADKEKQDKLNKDTIETLSKKASKKLKDFSGLFAKVPTEKNTERTLLEKHLAGYTARFNFDFFIHKDLEGFLKRELDFYIKNEMLFIDDLDAQDERKLKSEMAKVKVMKHIAVKIIIFLSQIEEFQKKLWLKKKMVLECGYCITLDRVPAEFYTEIAKNKAQTEEWVRLFAIDEIEDDLHNPGFSKTLTTKFLKANPYLFLDTKHFNEEFKDRLLNSIGNLDENCDGLIINSENFQTLNLLTAKYLNSIECAYIDPPYNTNNGDFLYKDNFQHSSWLAMINNRLNIMGRLLINEGRFFCSIDDRENANVLELLFSFFGDEKYLGAITWEKRTKSQNTETSKNMLQSKIEYIHPFSFSDKRQEFNLEVSGKKTYPEKDDRGVFRFQTLEEMSSESIRGRKTMIYPILGVSPRPGKQWQVGEDYINEMMSKKQVILKADWPCLKIRPDDEGQDKYRPFWSHFFDKETYGTAESGLDLVDKKLGFGKDFDTVKPIQLIQKLIFHVVNSETTVLDYFGGSGTTAHAVINLNREDDGKRKYILVEMGEYFDTVLKPRIQKVVYSKDWKDGKPVSREGISHMFKYMRLESYDDTLDNLVPARTPDQEASLLTASSKVREEYMLNYMLDFETRGSLLNISSFEDPFSYKILTRKDDELKPVNVDLIETFNYLVGLWVDRIDSVDGFKVVTGQLRTGEKTLVIWRNTKGKSHTDLNTLFRELYSKHKEGWDFIFVNGPNTLSNLKSASDRWIVRPIEDEFLKRMWETE